VFAYVSLLLIAILLVGAQAIGPLPFQTRSCSVAERAAGARDCAAAED